MNEHVFVSRFLLAEYCLGFSTPSGFGGLEALPRRVVRIVLLSERRSRNFPEALDEWWNNGRWNFWLSKIWLARLMSIALDGSGFLR
ncbi:uncharacterized protein H6S33_008002 [Morchella sextelata]|uniref:uncharacterized protein n=1 Tax=Morchella sextelata TaxID=1174677 RepID=UPI001D03E521|nr:uncharacterized protein H6S33_008002 [Morchella sextelata]KAH0602998.1 hypothetical protein H6S33_008002 [Morchella sextelata]